MQFWQPDNGVTLARHVPTDEVAVSNNMRVST
jgi:hypothetical protein